MIRKAMPVGLVVAALVGTAAPVLAHEGHEDGEAPCCPSEGGGGGKTAEPQSPDACCPAEGAPGQGKPDGADCGPGRRGQGGGMGGKWGHKRLAPEMELRYLTSTAAGNQFMILTGGLEISKNEWFSVGFQRNLALQTFAPGPAGFWAAPYGGLLPRVGYRVGEARGDLGVLIGGGAMGRTLSAGGIDDVLQLRLMWVVEPRIELGWSGDKWGVAFVGTYLMTQRMNDLGGPTLGVKVSFKGLGKMMGHPHHHGMMDDGDDDHHDHDHGMHDHPGM